MFLLVSVGIGALGPDLGSEQSIELPQVRDCPSSEPEWFPPPFWFPVPVALVWDNLQPHTYSKRSPSMNFGCPEAPFPKSLGACTPSHGHAQVSWLRHSLHPTSIPISLTCWQGHLSGDSGVPHLTGEASRDTVPSVGLAERQMDGAGGEGRRRRRMKALRAAGRGSRRHPWLCPSLSSPSCLISSPCSRHPAGAGGQGQTKAALLTAPPRKGLFFSPSAFLFKPLSPRLGRGHRLISAWARWEQEGADGSQAAGAAGPAAASSRRADARPTRGRINGSGGPWARRGCQGGLPPSSTPQCPWGCQHARDKEGSGPPKRGQEARGEGGREAVPSPSGTACWARSHCKGHGRIAAAFCPRWGYSDPLPLRCHGCSCPVLLQLGWRGGHAATLVPVGLQHPDPSLTSPVMTNQTVKLCLIPLQ